MALMLPERHPGTTSKAVAMVFRRIKHIPSSELVCRLALLLDGRSRPHFYAVYRGKYAFLIAVSDATTADLIGKIQGDLFTAGARAAIGDALNLQEQRMLLDFISDVAGEIGACARGDLPVERWILFPNADHESVRRFGEVAGALECRLFGREYCGIQALLELIEESASFPSDTQVLDVLQRMFSPEAAIPESWVPRRKEFTNAASQTQFFLDINQESLAKRDLELSPEAHAAAGETQLRLITGVAGSGKTLVLLYRARMLSMLNPDARILVLTHNRPLSADLNARLKQLAPESKLEWLTYFQWVTPFLKPPPDVIGATARRELIHEAARAECLLSRYPIPFLEEEFEWLTENGLTNEDAYIATERIGRQKGLKEGQRRDVYTLYRAYRQRLARQRKTDWPGVALRFLRQLQAGRAFVAPYDVILIDEAQFFSPVQFETIRMVTKPHGTQILMAADPTQGFLRSRQSWLQSGFEVRGRSQRLQQPYRSTRAILGFATRFYLNQLPDDDEEVNLPSPEQLAGISAGVSPQVEQCRSTQDEIARAANEAIKAVAGGAEPGSILLIHGDGIYTDDVLARLDTRTRGMGVDARHARDRSRVRVCSLNAVTGLEAPIVILFGVDSLLQSICAPSLDAADQAERRRMVTRKLFVGFTRCSDKLLVLCSDASSFSLLSGCVVEQ